MQSPFGRKEVPANTQQEIRERGTSAGVAWNAKKFPWVILTSLCSACPDGDAFTELSGKGPNYTLDSSVIGGSTAGNIFGNAGLTALSTVIGTQRPAPTIESVEVKKQGELGTTRKVIVNIKAYTDNQLRNLQKCFFIPQMGVRVQWGWSHTVQSAASPSGTPSPVVVITDRSLSDADAICQMQALERSNANYSGLQGIVANFSYNLTTDNYWDCSIEIIAATQALSGAKVNTYNCGCRRENDTKDEKGNSVKTTRIESDLVAHLRDFHENFPKAYSAYSSVLPNYGSNISLAYRVIKNMKQRNQSGNEETLGWGMWLASFAIGDNSWEGYISWGTVEALINYLVMDLGKQPGTKEKWLGRVQSDNVMLPGHSLVGSSDPKICYIPGGFYQDKLTTPDKGDNPPSAISGNFVQLSKIMVNAIFLINEVRAAEQNEGTLINFLNSTLKKISDACGGLWALEAVSTTEDCRPGQSRSKEPPTITIIDLKPYEAATAFTLPSSPNNSSVRDMKLDMKMTDAMKTQALYSGGPIAKIKSPSGGNCDGDTFRAFNAAGTSAYNLAKGPRTDEYASSNCGPSNTGALQSTGDTSLLATYRKMVDEGPSSPIVDAVKSLLIEGYNLTSGDAIVWASLPQIQKSTGAKRDHCKGVPLPFEFSFTVDGVGGFAFGQMVTSDRIPDEIRANFEWQVTSVEHSITTQDWTTTVNTVCRFKNN